MYNENTDSAQKGRETESKLLALLVALGYPVIELRHASDGGAPLVKEDREDKIVVPDFLVVNLMTMLESKGRTPGKRNGKASYPIVADKWDDYVEMSVDKGAPVMIVIEDYRTGQWYIQSVSTLSNNGDNACALDWSTRRQETDLWNEGKTREFVWLAREKFERAGFFPPSSTAIEA